MAVERFSKDIIKSLASSTKEKISGEWEKFEWSLAAKRYRQKIYDLYSTMRILGSPYPVPLEAIYTDLHILDKPTAYRRHNIEQLKAFHRCKPKTETETFILEMNFLMNSTTKSNALA
jgi:hypothetical protein